MTLVWDWTVAKRDVTRLSGSTRFDNVAGSARGVEMTVVKELAKARSETKGTFMVSECRLLDRICQG